MTHSIHYSDNLPVLRQMPDSSVDAIITDPPWKTDTDRKDYDDRDKWLEHVDKRYMRFSESYGISHPSILKVIDDARGEGVTMGSFLADMAMMMIEGWRVLKSTGSLALMIDQDTDHHVRRLGDSLFGPENFVNRIAWCYKGRRNAPRQFQRMHKTILIWRKSYSTIFNQQEGEYTESTKRTYKWAMKQGWHPGGVNTESPFVTVWDEAKVDEAIASGRLPVNVRRTYPKPPKMEDWWTDIPYTRGNSKEAVGYTDQKPEALYRRLMLALTNPEAIVLDPFLGSGTCIKAAHDLGRVGIGIDENPTAIDVSLKRLKKAGIEVSLNASLDDLESTGPAISLMSEGRIKDILDEAQKGVCAGCGRTCEYPYLEIDHLEPRALGGIDEIINRVLLCTPCNRQKQTRSLQKLWGVLKLARGRRAHKMHDWDAAKRAYNAARKVARRYRP